MVKQDPFYIERLKFEFEKRKEKNSSYSLRAFSKSLDINAGTLSRILKGERVPSLLLGEQFAVTLRINGKERESFLNSLAGAKWREKPLRVSTLLREFSSDDSNSRLGKNSVYKINLEHYRYLADWIHYALLELTYVSDFDSNPRWIANKLGRSIKDVEEAIVRLKSFGLLEEKNGRLRKTKARITTLDKSQTTRPLRKLQKDILTNAIEGIDLVEFEKRISVSMTMAINTKNIEKAKHAFVEFSEKICDLLEEGERTEVYNLVVNLTPVGVKK